MGLLTATLRLQASLFGCSVGAVLDSCELQLWQLGRQCCHCTTGAGAGAGLGSERPECLVSLAHSTEFMAATGTSERSGTRLAPHWQYWRDTAALTQCTRGLLGLSVGGRLLKLCAFSRFWVKLLLS